MKNLLVAFAVSAISLTAASVSQAATFVYQLGDHPDRGQADVFAFGLILQREDPDRYFSFDNGGNATLTYDDVALEATIEGTVVESLGVDASGAFIFGDTFNVTYSLDSLENLGPVGSGGFIDTVGNGSGTLTGTNGDMTELLLGSAAKPDGTIYAGEFFRFGEDALSDRAFTGFEGTGWVQSSPGFNDFLFTGELIATPLPAAAWLLLAGVGGLGVMRRRQTKS